MIAALYVQPRGVYAGLPHVECWDEARDARRYDGPWPVVAHPPCARWGRYWFGGPTIVRQRREYLEKGDDGGCFAAALAAIRRWGGVLEHPEGSHAWRHFHLNVPPRSGGWVVADWQGGWTCCVEQGWYGHRARKATWLYAHGVELPILRWGSAPGDFVRIDLSVRTPEERRRIIRTGACQQMSKNQRAATPPEFRDLLLSIAETAGRGAGRERSSRVLPTAPCVSPSAGPAE